MIDRGIYIGINKYLKREGERERVISIANLAHRFRSILSDHCSRRHVRETCRNEGALLAHMKYR